MGNLLFAIFLLTFSIFVHELGHFFVARWRGLATPRFSIFGIGNPIWKWKWRGVEYCVCWLPIGAYVMIPQLVDLGEFEGDLPDEARNLPKAGYLSKVLVALAGPCANILLALALACIVWKVGMQVPAEYNRTEIGEVYREIVNADGKTVPGPAAAAGLQEGDIIRQVDGRSVSNFSDIYYAIALGSNRTPDGRRVAEITFERNGRTITSQVFPEIAGSTDSYRNIGIRPRASLVVGRVEEGSPAAQAGLAKDDRIISVDGRPINRTEELGEHFQKKHSEPSSLLIKRGEQEITAMVQPRLRAINGNNLYLIGIGWGSEMTTIYPTPFAQVGQAVDLIYRTLSSLLNRNSDVGLQHAQGIIGMVDNLETAVTYGFIPALALIIAINVSLAILNLLPIPVLDGGHIMFATIAKLRGKPISRTFMQNAVAACFFLIIGLMVYVGYHDIRRLIHERFSPSEQTAPAKPAEPAPAKP